MMFHSLIRKNSMNLAFKLIVLGGRLRNKTNLTINESNEAENNTFEKRKLNIEDLTHT